ncbi:MAG TPA: hypothetical protein DHV85_05925 [Candidatus Accumulibacter sp.]|nr:hypothetical protein [Accumulibacter sp.]
MAGSGFAQFGGLFRLDHMPAVRLRVTESAASRVQSAWRHFLDQVLVLRRCDAVDFPVRQTVAGTLE